MRTARKMTRDGEGSGNEASGTGATDPSGSGAAEGHAEKGCILVADDNEDCRMALCALLESLGYRVLEADDGESAVAVARDEEPDLILMDIMMPGVDGLEATRKIRSSSLEDGTRIVAVSAMEGARQASLAAGCDDCILKPLDLKHLDELVAGWMS